MQALLDVNVLIALLDAGHLMHNAATKWLAQHAKKGWATCATTQMAVVRIMSQPAYPTPKPAAQVAERLALACADVSHAFWSESMSVVSNPTIRWGHVLGHRQVTDTYLLALAVHHHGVFATFDQRISTNTVLNAKPKQLELIH